jgi:membrane protein DedA with SNARE-associated domain
MFTPAADPTGQAFLITALVAQFLKELGVPSPGVTQSAVIYAGCQLALGNAAGLLIIGAVLAGFIGGSATAYFIGHFFGKRLIDKLGKWLHVSPERLAETRSRISAKSRRAVFVGRFVPAMMLPLSLAAGAVRMPLPRFYASVGTAMILWTAVFIGLGIMFRGSISQAAGQLNNPLVYGAAALSVFIGGSGLLARRFLPRLFKNIPIRPEA